MKQYRCWLPDNADGHEAETVESAVGTASWAAELFAEKCWTAVDSFNEIEVCVKDEAGEVTRWLVVVEAVPSFTATKVKQDHGRLRSV